MPQDTLPSILHAPYADFPTPPPSLGSPRILIQKRGALGDILEATPILASLRTAYPDAFITWLAAENTYEALASRADLQEVIAWDGRYWKDLRRDKGQWPYLTARTRFWRGLRARRYDIFLSLEGHEMTWLPWASGASRRVGMWARGLTARAYRHVIPPGAGRSRIDGYLEVIRALGLPEAPPVMTLPLLPDDRIAADQLLKQAGLNAAPFIVVHPRANWVTRNWPSERFAAVIDALAAEPGVRCIVTGSTDQYAEVEEIMTLCHKAVPFNAAGRTPTIRHLAALISRADAVLTVDTSAMHLAATVGTPCVTVFGATDYRRIVPPPPARCLPVFDYPACGPCRQAECSNRTDPLVCLRNVSAQSVLQAIGKVLDQRRGAAVSPLSCV